MFVWDDRVLPVSIGVPRRGWPGWPGAVGWMARPSVEYLPRVGPS